MNEATDVQTHCKCQVCHYSFIVSLFFKAYFSQNSLPRYLLATCYPYSRAPSETNPATITATTPPSNTAGLLATASKNLEDPPV